MVTYRLQSFPEVCVHCLKPVKPNFASVDSYRLELGNTIEQTCLQLGINGEHAMDHTERNSMLPCKICEDCLAILISIHQFRRKWQIVRRFNTGLVQLIHGDSAALKELYATEGVCLAQVLKDLNICELPYENITLDRLIEEISLFELNGNRSFQRPQHAAAERTKVETPSSHDFTVSPNRGVQIKGTTMECFIGGYEMQSNDYVNCTRKDRGNQFFKKEIDNDNVILPESHACIPAPNFAMFETLKMQSKMQVDLVDSQNRIGSQQDQQELMHAQSPVRTTENQRSTKVKKKSNVSSADAHCKICRKTFRSRDALVRHYNVHSPSRNFQCPDCPMAFKNAYHLKRHHETVHLAMRYTCTFCNKAFSRKEKLRNHVEISHEIQCYFYCDICLMSYESENLLETHTNRHKYPKRNECGTCLESYQDGNDFDGHVCITYQDNYECCGKDFATHYLYNQHMMAEHNVKMKARVKLPKGTLLSKYRSTIGAKEFYCELCETQLKTKGHYQQHISTRRHLNNVVLSPCH